MQLLMSAGVKIDITDDGFVSVCGLDQAGMDQAIEVYQDNRKRLRRR